MSDQRLTVPSIRMGEMVATHEGSLRSLLGSCVGVALYDRNNRVGGLAHIVLPDSRGNGETPGKFVDTALPMLVSQLQKLGPRRMRLEAKIAGGANMFKSGSATPIGAQNVDAVEKVLAGLGIALVAKHCGGTQGRRMTLEIPGGRVSIDVVGAETIEI